MNAAILLLLMLTKVSSSDTNDLPDTTDLPDNNDPSTNNPENSGTCEGDDTNIEKPNYCVEETTLPFPHCEGRVWLLPIYIVLCIYLFCWTAKGADEFLMPNLEIIQKRYNIPEDFAGATIMAIGGSTPELTLSLLSCTKGDDQGIGTIIGSTMFNLLFIQCACVVANGNGLTITPFNLIRDSIMQIITGASLFFVAWFNIGGFDGEDSKSISWIECLILVVIYIGYVVFMAFNQKIQSKLTCCPQTPEEKPVGNRLSARSALGRSSIADAQIDDKADVEENPVVEEKPVGNRLSAGSALAQARSSLNMKLGRSSIADAQIDDKADVITNTNVAVELEEDESEWGMVGCACWYFTLPIYYIFYAVNLDFLFDEPHNIETCPCWKPFYAFFINIAMIGGACVVISDTAALIGQYFHVPSFLVGVTILAIGTSIPDTFASMWCAKNDLGDMAICSGYGSNIFNVHVGLAVPWLIYCFVNWGEKDQPINVDALPKAVGAMVGISVINLLCLWLCGWKLTKYLGYIDGGLYLVYIAMEITGYCLEWPGFQ